MDGNGGGGGGGAGSSYPGVQASGASTASTVTTATSQTPSRAVTLSWITLVFSGKFSADIKGSVVSGGLKIRSSRGVVVSVTGDLVIQTANGDKFRVGVYISRFFGSYSGQVSVSGPGIHTSAFVSTRHLALSNGLVTGQGRGFNGFASYSLSFTL